MKSRLLLQVTAVSIILTLYSCFFFSRELILFTGVPSICKCSAKYKLSKRRYSRFNFEKLQKQVNWEFFNSGRIRVKLRMHQNWMYYFI